MYCVNVCRIGIITRDYSAVPYCTTKKWSVHPFIRTALLVNEVKLLLCKNTRDPGRQN